MESISDSKEKEKGRVQRVLSGKERERVSGVKLKTTLKRCPFCGKEVDTEIGIGGIRFFNCTNKRCGAMVSFRNYIKGRLEAEKWNSRAEDNG